MSYLLVDPTAALVVGGSAEAVDRVRASLTDAATPTVPTADAVDDALDALDERDDVGCVVVLNPDGAAPSEACAAIREDHEGLPIVVHASPDEVDHAALAQLADCRYLPRAADEGALADAVAAALDAYAERRDRRAESSLWRTLLAEGERSIFAKDERGRHLYKADLRDGDDPDEVRGKTDLELADEKLREESERSLRDDTAVVETGDPIYAQEEDYSYGGDTFWTEVTKVPWRDADGDVQGLVGVAIPITERKRYEQRVAEQSERIDQFVSYVTHDLRTPLQIAFGAIERARRGDDEALDKVREATERINDIVDDLSRLSKRDDAEVSADALAALREGAPTTELVPLLEGVWRVLAPPPADLVVELPDETVVGAETETLRPIVENLFTNAVDHAGPDVTVRVGETADGGLYVEDDGDGIPPDEREAVLRAGYTTAADGSGTGLRIVAETVERQGWELSVTDGRPRDGVDREHRSGATADAADAWTTATESTDGGRARGARFEIEGIPLITRPVSDLVPGERIELGDGRDVGPVSVPGSAEYDAAGDRWTVVANGRNVWGDTHEFHWVGATADAPVRIEGQVADLDGPSEYSKAGVAVRAGDEQFAPFGYVGRSRDHGSEVTWRASADGHTASDQLEEPAGAFPWYRVEYVDGVVTCFLSADGAEWHPVDQRALDLGESVSVGLLVCSHAGEATCEATFADVRAHRLTDGTAE